MTFDHYLQKLLVLPVILAISTPLLAADPAGNYAIWGAGARSCHQFLRAVGDEAQLSGYRDYVMGYLTAVNTLSASTYDAVGGESLETTLKWINDYCAGHKIESFERALTQLIDARHEQRLRQPPGATRGWGGGGAPPSSAQ